MNKNRLFGLTLAIVCSLGSLAVPAHASPTAAAPTPPRDAKKVAYSLKSGSIKLDVENDEKVAPQQVKDFDVAASFINPGLPRWTYGFILRRQPEQGALVFTIDETGNAMVGVVKDKYVPLKDPVAATKLRKNTGEKNEVALYVRGSQIMAFVNKAYVYTWTTEEFPDAGEVALIAFTAAEKPTGEIKFTNFIVRTPPNAAPGAAVAPTATPSGEKIPTGNIQVELVGTVSSIPWGRPAGMRDPNAGCNAFDDSSPVQQIQIPLRITNTSSKPMEAFFPVVLKPGNVQAFTCFYNYGGAANVLNPGESRNLTFAAFIEQGESVAQVFVVDEKLGISNRLNLP